MLPETNEESVMRCPITGLKKMISMIFSYILLGISLSAPVGPINVAQINKGIKMVLSAWLVGVGAMSADVVMMF